MFLSIHPKGIVSLGPRIFHLLFHYEYNGYLSFIEGTKQRVHQLISVLWVYLSSFTNKIFYSPNSHKRNSWPCPFLRDWEVKPYPIAISPQNHFFSTSKVCTCFFFKTANESITKISFWSGKQLSFIFLLVFPQPPAKI